MSFTLSTGNVAYPSASASVSNGTTSSTVTVTASCYLYDGWVYSTGVVAKIYIDGSLVSTQTLLGNGAYYYASDGTKSVSASKSISKTTSSQNVSWYVQFWQYTDGYEQSHKATVSGTSSVSALPSYAVTYNANGGSGAPGSQTKWHGTNLTLSSTKPTRTGYSFLRWNTNSSGTGTNYNSGATYSANAAVTLYAVWQANTYTVSYNANGGTGAPGNQTKTYGVDLTLSSTKPTRTNYNFLGWGTSSSATTVAYASGATYTNNSAVTLYAIWELAYVPPSINDLSIYRCDENGNLTDTGTWYRMTFDWVCDQTIGSNPVSKIQFNRNNQGWDNSISFTAGSTSGHVSHVAGGGVTDIEISHTIKIRVIDSTGGSTTKTMVLPSTTFPVDYLVGGRGLAFGKAASKNNWVESAWPIEHVRNDGKADCAFIANRADTGTRTFFGIGKGGKNFGIYNNVTDKWLLYNNGNSGDNAVRTNGSVRIETSPGGVYVKDSTGFSYPLVYDNGTNLFIGASQTATRHHTGRTVISAGNVSAAEGNETIYVCVPDGSDSTTGTSYGVLHSGNCDKYASTMLQTFRVANHTTRSTSIAYTGLSWTCPVSAFICVTGRGIFSNSSCSSVGLSTSSASSIYMDVYSSNVDLGTGSCACTYLGYADAGTTLYLWGSWNAASANSAYIQGFYFPA